MKSARISGCETRDGLDSPVRNHNSDQESLRVFKPRRSIGVTCRSGSGRSAINEKEGCRSLMTEQELNEQWTLLQDFGALQCLPISIMLQRLEC